MTSEQNDSAVSKKVVLVAKNNAWAAHITQQDATIFTEEGAAKKSNPNSNTYRMVFTDKELFEYIKKRDNKLCRYCKNTGEILDWIIPEKFGGFETPANVVFSCKSCKEKKKNTSIDEIKLNFSFLKEENLKMLNQENIVVKNCSSCKQTKEIHHFRFIDENYHTNFCKQCFTDNKLIYLIDDKNQIIGADYKEKIDDLISKGLAKQIGPKTAIVFENIVQKKCLICNQLKNVTLFIDTLCDICHASRKLEGVSELFNIMSDSYIFISKELEQSLLRRNIVVRRSENSVVYRNFFEQLLCFLQPPTKKVPYILVSRSGKWSSNISEKTTNILLKEGLVDFQDQTRNVIRMNVSIERFKEHILKRDNYTCHFCKGVGMGVFSYKKIKTYENSVCVCLDCEYERDPLKFIKWLNIHPFEPRFLSPTRFSKKVILWEKSKTNKFSIHLDTATQLVDEKMAIWTGKKKIDMLYDIRSFRQFILDRDGKKCHYCNKKGHTIDHIIPKSKGGITTPTNCVCACEPCNIKKGNREAEKFIKNFHHKKKKGQ
jgi:5-methylcytosine-specific restriction endonuclease McrA